MNYYEYITEKLHALGNLSFEKKKEIVTNMLASNFNIPVEIAYLAVQGATTMQSEAFKKGLNSVYNLIKVSYSG